MCLSMLCAYWFFDFIYMLNKMNTHIYMTLVKTMTKRITVYNKTYVTMR